MRRGGRLGHWYKCRRESEEIAGHCVMLREDVHTCWDPIVLATRRAIVLQQRRPEDCPGQGSRYLTVSPVPLATSDQAATVNTRQAEEVKSVRLSSESIDPYPAPLLPPSPPSLAKRRKS